MPPNTDDTTDVPTEALKTIARSQQELNALLDELEGEARSLVWTATDQLEQILVTEAPKALAACDHEPIATDGGFVEDDEDATADVQAVEAQVVDVLEPFDGEATDWEELLDAVDVDEDVLEETISDLQAADVVRYNGRKGGYVLGSER